MKKTVSILLAVMFALAAIFSLSMIAFADGEDDPAAPVATTEAREDERRTTAATTTTAPTTASDVGALVDKLTTVSTTTIPDKVTEDNAEIATGGTAVVDEPINTTTRKASNVSSSIPNTGSSAAVTAIAVLALAAGAIAVVKTKKEG